jgi:hypothetical protein
MPEGSPFLARREQENAPSKKRTGAGKERHRKERHRQEGQTFIE